MKKNTINLNQLKNIIKTAAKYKFFIYLIFILILYGYLIIKVADLNQINTNIVPNPKNNNILMPQTIKPTVINQLKNLNNNSVQVKTLFQNSRSNPF
jgi:hypothetical protein